MFKKLLLLASVFTAIAAFAMPAAAGAAAITQPSGTLIPTGATILGTSGTEGFTGAWTVATELGTLECPTVQLSLKVTENTGSTFAASGSGTTVGQCRLTSGGEEFKIKITNLTVSELMSTGSTGNTDIAFSFEADLPGFTCEFHTLTPPTGITAFYAPGGDALTTIEEFITGEVCGAGVYSGEFSFTRNGSPVIFD